MEIVEQTHSRLIIIHKSSCGIRLLGLTGALLFLGISLLFIRTLIEGTGGGVIFGFFFVVFLILPCLFLVYVCLNTFFSKQTYVFDKDANKFTVIVRTALGSKKHAGAISGILSTNHKIDYSGVDSETGPSSEIIIRYKVTAGTQTITCGLGIADEDERLYKTLRAFLKS